MQPVIKFPQIFEKMPHFKQENEVVLGKKKSHKYHLNFTETALYYQCEGLFVSFGYWKEKPLNLLSQVFDIWQTDSEW